VKDRRDPTAGVNSHRVMSPLARRACVLIVLAWAVLTCAKTKDPTGPETFEAKSDQATLIQAHGAIDVFELPVGDETFKALVFKLPKASKDDSDYRIYFYRRNGEVFLRHGAEQNIVNFERPRLSTASNKLRIETIERRLGLPFHFRVTTGGVDLVPTKDP
jgi:hypothetical protein